MSDPLNNENVSNEIFKNEVEQTEVAATSAAVRSPGAQLASAREQYGWTVEQVASHLKLAPRQVIALECDDYASLPGMPIVRGFIRSYAKLLKLDSAPLLAQLGGERVLANEPLTPSEGLSTPFAATRLPSMSEKPGISSKWVVGVLLLGLLVAALWAVQQDGNVLGLSQSQQPTINEASTKESSVAPEPGSGLLTQDAQTGDQQENMPALAEPVPGEQGIPPAASVAMPTSEPAPDVAPSVTQATPAEPQNAEGRATGADAGTNTLDLKLREDSWVEIRPSNGGKALVSRLMTAGETASVEVTEPVVMVIGNAAGVDASLRGEPIQLKASTTTNVARISLK